MNVELSVCCSCGSSTLLRCRCGFSFLLSHLLPSVFLRTFSCNMNTKCGCACMSMKPWIIPNKHRPPSTDVDVAPEWCPTAFTLRVSQLPASVTQHYSVMMVLHCCVKQHYMYNIFIYIHVYVYICVWLQSLYYFTFIWLIFLFIVKSIEKRLNVATYQLDNDWLSLLTFLRSVAGVNFVRMIELEWSVTNAPHTLALTVLQHHVSAVRPPQWAGSW